MIQIDMPMPKYCDECFALDDHGDYPFCLISEDQRGYNFNTWQNRMPSCPLKPQESRVMTLEEVKSLERDAVVWYEHDGKNGPRPRIVHYADSQYIVFTDGGKWQFEADGYGSRWHCWTSRPDKKRMEETLWE